MKVTSKLDQDYLKIYFDEILHLSLSHSDLLGVQAWVDQSWFWVDFTFSGGKISSQYAIKEHWEEVLKEIDKYV